MHRWFGNLVEQLVVLDIILLVMFSYGYAVEESVY